MKFNQYKNNRRAELLPVEIKGEEIEDIYFRRLSAGEGLHLKEAFSGLIDKAGTDAAALASGDAETAGKAAAAKLSPDQLKALFEFQALFCFLHFGNAKGERMYDQRGDFNEEVPDEFVQAFYAAGSELKNKTEPTVEDAEKNS